MTMAFVFPGQGSQSMGMLAEMSEHFPEILNTFEEASEVLDYDLWQLVLQGPVERINRTEVTQPLVLTADIALWRLWCQESTLRPECFAGHSLGEYAALVAASVLDFSDAVAITAERGRLMQLASPLGVGAMAAVIGLSVEAAEDLCAHCREDLVLDIANINSVGQIVIAGHTAAVERAVSSARQFGAKLAKMLPVSVPSHSPLMQSAVAPFEAFLQPFEFCSPSLPIIHNADCDSHSDPVQIKALMVAQLTHPVAWVATIEKCIDQSVDTFVECGPGTVLQGLIKRINKQQKIMGMSTLSQWEQLMELTQEFQS